MAARMPQNNIFHSEADRLNDVGMAFVELGKLVVFGFQLK